MNKLYEQVELILRKYQVDDPKVWAKALIDSHLLGGRLHSHLGLSINKSNTLTKRLFPNKKPLVKVLTYILAEENLKLCKYCQTIKEMKFFSPGNSNCKECHNQQQQIYYYKNPEAQSQRVRKRDRYLDRALTQEEIQVIFSKYNNKCAVCNYTNEQHNIDWGTNLHIDHIIPLSKGGLTTVSNSQLLCIKCNTSKGGRIE